jgi:hypothetical protein
MSGFPTKTDDGKYKFKVNPDLEELANALSDPVRNKALNAWGDKPSGEAKVAFIDGFRAGMKEGVAFKIHGETLARNVSDACTGLQDDLQHISDMIDMNEPVSKFLIDIIKKGVERIHTNATEHGWEDK